MKQLLTLTTGFIFLIQFGYGQEQTEPPTKPHITVTGHAEKKIIPDEIYLSITIKERETGRDKITVAQQVEDLKKALLNLKIPQENLSVSDANADYIKVKWSKKDVISQSEYELKLANAQQVVDVFRQLDELKIDNAYISRVSHSEIKNLKKEVEIEAIKSAKSKADYLLAAIGQETGSALIVDERFGIDNNLILDRALSRVNTNYDEIQYVRPGQDKVLGIIEFKKIKLESYIYVKFEIKQ